MSLFNDTQRLVLGSIIDTIIAPIQDDAIVNNIINSKVCQPGMENVSKEEILSFLKCKGTDSNHNLILIIENALEKNMPVDVSNELKLLLTAMSTSVGMLALSLSLSSSQPFYKLNYTLREKFLQDLSHSMIGLKRKAYLSLRQLICIKAFGTGPNNSFWNSFGYDGPRNTKEVLNGQQFDPHDQQEFNFKPYCVTKEEAMARMNDYDVIVVGSGCGGSVVVERCASNGLKVLLIEKGSYYQRCELSGSEECFDQLYERGGLCVTEDTGMAVLAGSTFGGGTAVNWACCLEPPRYVREEWCNDYGLTHFTTPTFQKSLNKVTQRLQVVGGRYGGRLDQNVNNQSEFIF
jgi:long-chain-alcohol oxidase